MRFFSRSSKKTKRLKCFKLYIYIFGEDLCNAGLLDSDSLFIPLLEAIREVTFNIQGFLFFNMPRRIGKYWELTIIGEETRL